MKTIVWHNHITRQTLRDNPKNVFLFGDNMLHIGMSGMAKEMRGEPNAMGLPTKVRPSMDEAAFFSDVDFGYVSKFIDIIFAEAQILALKLGGDVIIPYGLGRGLAELPRRAPKIWAYLQKKIQEAL